MSVTVVDFVKQERMACLSVCALPVNMEGLFILLIIITLLSKKGMSDNNNTGYYFSRTAFVRMISTSVYCQTSVIRVQDVKI